MGQEEEKKEMRDMEEKRRVIMVKLGSVFGKEVKKASKIAAPMVVATVLQYLVQVAPVMMVGHLGQLSLSSVAIATSLTNVSGFSLLSGMAGGLETLCGQAYGAQQYQKLGTYTYSAIISLILVCLLVCLLWIFMDKLLILIGQDPLISHEARNYAIWLIPGLFGSAILKPLTRYFQTQSLILPMLMSSFIILCVHVPLCWALVFKLKLGNVGAAVSISLSCWLNVIFLVVYMMFSLVCEKTRIPFSKDALLGLGEFFKFAVPSAVMVWYYFHSHTSIKKMGLQSINMPFKLSQNSLKHEFFRLIMCSGKPAVIPDEIRVSGYIALLFSVFYFLFFFWCLCICSLKWWSCELLILLAGILPNPKLETSVLSICLTISTLHFTISYGLGVAASTRVSNELGAGNPKAAKLAVWVTMCLAIMEAIIVGITIFCSRYVLGYAYSNEKQVVKYVATMAPLVCLSIIMDSLQAVLSGVARGSGWQHIGAYVNLGAFYLAGLPIAIMLGFVLHLKGKGFWIGIVAGSAVQLTLLSLITAFTNWQKQASKARERIFVGRS